MLQGGVEGGIEFVNYIGRCAARGKHTHPLGHTETGIARLGHSGHVGQSRVSVAAAHRQGLQFARGDEGISRGQHGKYKGDVTGDQVGHHRATALIGDVLNLNAGCVLEHLGGEVVATAVAC